MDHQRLTNDSERIQGSPIEDLMEQVPFQHYAERFVDAAPAHQELPVATLPNPANRFISIIVHVDPVDIHSGSHDVANAAVADIENSFDQFLLCLLQQTAFLTGRD